MFYKKAYMLVMMFLCQYINVAYCDVLEITNNSIFLEWCRNQQIMSENLILPNISNDLVDERLNANQQGKDYTYDPFWNTSRFKQFIHENFNISVKDENTFSDFFACYKNKTITWQQAGCALFVPQNDSETQSRAYVALKRSTTKSDSTCHNTSTTSDDLTKIFSYEHHIHTERQLAVVALENALSNESLPTDNSGIIRPYLKEHIHEVEELQAEKRNNLCGTLYLYTQSSPCRDSYEHNDNISCIEYYKKLIKMFPKVTFKIFFNKKRLQLSKKIELNKEQLQRINLEKKQHNLKLDLDTDNTLSKQHKKNYTTKMEQLLNVAASQKSTYKEETLSKSIKYLPIGTQEMLFNAIYYPSEKQQIYHLIDML